MNYARYPNREHDRARQVAGLLARLRLDWLLSHLPPRVVWAAYVFINGFVTIALLSVLAFVTRTPFVFPSLGPTAFLFFFAPLSDAASPRHAILGHAVGLICGYGAYILMGSHGFAGAALQGASWPAVTAAALSLAATGGGMALFRISHPPAGATTMIVSLGILANVEYLFVIEAAVVLLTAQAWIINRLAGLDYPVWEKRNG
ncbi:HPP family protein [Alloacidobacterium sp.]|uniref:HPP family protein n=1 Tax=Alloacidobacterium sp. TaxID=2951999 RepID=UPI002D5F8A5E|nr:HPP family protein [Alloacidobacterium sp.]HYK38221.1 HPP family protein [Alloacidobacterium sp.]